MSERPHGIDAEIDVRSIARLGIWLAVLTALGCAVAVGVYFLFASSEERRDPAPSPLAEAAERRLPPGPRLQSTPELELTRVRHAEDALLESWGWVDRGQGLAHVPIERAIDAVADAGTLPDFTPVPPAAEPAP